MTPEDLYQAALANMEREDDGTFYRLSDFVESVLHTTPESSGLDMYIMTNKKCAYGATEILRSGELKRRAEEFKSDLVVLPSSVHEVLVLPYEEWMDLDVKYVKERSFWVDWKIIFKTFKVCLLGRGE